MKYGHLLLLLSFFLSPTLHAEAITESDILGLWLNQAGDGIVEISQKDQKYQAIIVGSTDGKDRLDKHNPDPALRSKSLLHAKVLGDFQYVGQNQWQDGWVYDPNNGKTYSCKMSLNNKDELKIRGYIGISLFGRTEIWTKYKGKATTP